MRLAIISDVHGNLEALSTVLEDIDRRSVDAMLCLGDVVGYGPDPGPCLTAIRTRDIPCLLGNHDAAAFDVDERLTFSPLARRAIEWTATQLSDDDLAFLRTFVPTIERYGQTFVHAAPNDPMAFDYIMDDVDAARNFHAFSTPICFVGHTHQPEIFPEDLSSRQVVPGRRFIVNVGSVGQPRDGDARACYGLFDSDAVTFEHVRVRYDVPTTAEKIYRAGLPAQLAERLVLGI